MCTFIKNTYCSYYVAIQKWISSIQSGFGYPRVSVLGMDFNPNRYSDRIRVLSLSFGFGCPDTPPTRTRPVAVPTANCMQRPFYPSSIPTRLDVGWNLVEKMNENSRAPSWDRAYSRGWICMCMWYSAFVYSNYGIGNKLKKTIDSMKKKKTMFELYFL